MVSETNRVSAFLLQRVAAVRVGDHKKTRKPAARGIQVVQLCTKDELIIKLRPIKLTKTTNYTT